MINRNRYLIWLNHLLIILILSVSKGKAQPLLEKNILLEATNRKLSEVLQILEQQGGFRFSFNSNIIPLDSVVNLNAVNLSIEESLNLLFSNKYDYKEARNFIILRYAPFKLSLILHESHNYENEFLVRGQVLDYDTRLPIINASVYEKNLLQTVLTDSNGFFTLKLKNFTQTINITVSKESYRDINTILLSEVVVKSRRRDVQGGYMEGDLLEMERTRLGRLLLTSKQKIQSVNLGNFIAQAPVQVSLSPGLSSHGSLSGQVVNKFSFNTTGAYSAGVDGMEIGLLFNIIKKDVRWLQFGGAFNLVGGKAEGLQIAGIYNGIRESFRGFQVSLGLNQIHRSFQGFQIGGIANQIGEDLSGLQFSLAYNRIKGNQKGVQIGSVNNIGASSKGVKLAMAANYTQEDAKGVELAGFFNYSKMFRGTRVALLGNISTESTEGRQLAGIFNYAKHLKGLQIGLINIADTSSGYSIGLINWIRNGYHKVSVTTNEIAGINIALKTGNEKLYSLLLVGQNTGNNHKPNSYGFGFGREMQIRERFFFNPEISMRFLDYGTQTKGSFLNRIDFGFAYRVNKLIALNMGPALNIIFANPLDRKDNYHKHESLSFRNSNYEGWIGWNLGFTFF